MEATVGALCGKLCMDIGVNNERTVVGQWQGIGGIVGEKMEEQFREMGVTMWGTMKETIGKTIAQQFNGATMGAKGEKNVEDNEGYTVETIRGQ